VWSTETTVRWESTEVFVQVRYDARRSFEVGLEIDQLAKDTAQFGPPFSLGEVLGLVGVDLAHRPFFQASSEEDLNKALKTMARLLLQDGKQLLLNDGAAFRSLARQRDKDCREYAQNKRLTFMRAAAEKAWHEKDYKAVVDIYQAEMPHLSPAELKRYEIAFVL
jgi:hypothetical protein